MLSAVACLVIAFSSSSVFAACPCAKAATPQTPPPANDSFGPPPPPCNIPPKVMEKMKKEHAKRKAEIDARLKLTEDQKKAVEQNRQEGRQKMKPVFDQLRAKRAKIEEINASCQNQCEKDKQITQIKSELKDLKAQAECIRKENMQKFEAILTPAQKCEFEKIKQEHRQKMEKEFKHHQHHGEMMPPPSHQ